MLAIAFRKMDSGPCLSRTLSSLSFFNIPEKENSKKDGLDFRDTNSKKVELKNKCSINKALHNIIPKRDS